MNELANECAYKQMDQRKGDSATASTSSPANTRQEQVKLS